MNPIYAFFTWCSGARTYILKQCPTEWNKYFGIGIIIFLTGTLAFISGAYAIYTVFQNTLISLAFGAFWGVLIFFLDWYLVSSMHKTGKTGKELLVAFPRLILAILIAVVISKPLELKLFEREIDKHLITVNNQKSLEIIESVDNQFAELQKLEVQNDLLRNQIQEKETLRQQLFNLMITEAEGNSPTGRAGKGSVYREKREQYEIISNELALLRQSNNQQIDKNQKKIDEIKTKRQTKIDENLIVNEKSDGLLARIKALSDLSDKEKSIAFTSWFILVLFIVVESAPLIVKLLAARGPYEHLYELEEYRLMVDAKLQHNKLKIKANANNNAELEYTDAYNQFRKNSDQDYLKKLLESNKNIIEQKHAIWLKNEENKLKRMRDELGIKNDLETDSQKTGIANNTLRIIKPLLRRKKSR